MAHRSQEKVVNFGSVQDELNASNYAEEKHYLDFMENKGEDDWIKMTTSSQLESFYTYWKKAALLYNNFYLPVNYFLHAEENCVYILDHEKHELNKFALNGKLIYQKPLQYSKDREWSEKIFKDLKTGKLYTYMNYRSGKLFMEIDLSSGLVKPLIEFNLSFIEHFKIYDETIYFTNSGLVAGQEARVLKKMRL